ncbi:helix-turn-helix domain-containing protein [Chloroflexota bacterium]
MPEAAAMLGISRNFCYQLVRDGKLPSIRFGKRILIPRVALEKMLEKGMPE